MVSQRLYAYSNEYSFILVLCTAVRILRVLILILYMENGTILFNLFFTCLYRLVRLILGPNVHNS